MDKRLFVNTHGSDLMTTVLCVVNKKKVDAFEKTYWTCLIEYYRNDYDSWKKRTYNLIKAANHDIKDEKQHE